MKRLWPWLVALLLFLGVGYFVADNQWRVGERNALGSVDSCYAVRGYPRDRVDAAAIPPAIVEECTLPMRRHRETMMPWLIAAAAGAIAALIALAAIFGLRRATRSEAPTNSG